MVTTARNMRAAVCGPGSWWTLWLRLLADTFGRGSGTWATVAPVPA